MNQYLDFFHTQRARIDAHALPLLNAGRDAAAAAFARLGFPSRKMERYRYTDVADVFAPNYGIQVDGKQDNGTPADALCQQLYGTLADVEGDALTALNAMLTQDLTVVHVAAGERRQRPVRLTTRLRSTAPLMQNRRLLVVAEAGAEVQLLLGEHSEEGQDYLSTLVTEVFVGEGAHVEFYDLGHTHYRHHRFHQLYADVAAGGHFTHAAFTLSGGVSRNQTDVRLTGEGAEANLLGCTIADGTQHVDNNTLIDHRAPGCRSRELYKYVVDGHATGAFAGRVLVREEAQQTESEERNANLICTTDARMYTQPMLEIYADDVQCSHGSTVGQLAADALFYMRQRGISEAEARLLLKQAFASEVINQIPLEALRPQLHHLVEKRFRSCDDCQLCNR